jgi:cytochrome c peroxidase
MKRVSQGGVQLSDQEKISLKAFLLTLTDFEFIDNPNFRD